MRWNSDDMSIKKVVCLILRVYHHFFTTFSCKIGHSLGVPENTLLDLLLPVNKESARDNCKKVF